MAEETVVAKYLLLSCMDHRHMDDVVDAMRTILQASGEAGAEAQRGSGDPVDLYDHLILAGAALGAVQSSYPAWGQTFWEHLAIARKLHTAIHTVVILQHEDCGAFRHLLGDNSREAHQRIARTLGQQIRCREGLRDLAVQYWILVKGEADAKAAVPGKGGSTWVPVRLLDDEPFPAPST